MNKVNNIQGLMYLGPDDIKPFDDNPFEVRHDEEMEKLIESIREYGILTPLVVSRQGRKGDVIQLVSGHRRLYAAKEIGLQVVPVSYATMTPEEIAIAVVDSNLQREHILPSEKAKAYKLKLDALKHQGKATSTQLGQKLSIEEVADKSDDSREQVRRYIRLNNLIPELLQMVDEEKIALTPAVELSYLTEEEQKDLLETIGSEDATPSLSQACQMKRLSQAGILDMDRIFEIMVKPKANQKISLKVSIEKLQKIAPKVKEKDFEDFVLKACEHYYKYLQKQRNRDRDAR